MKFKIYREIVCSRFQYSVMNEDEKYLGAFNSESEANEFINTIKENGGTKKLVKEVEI